MRLRRLKLPVLSRLTWAWLTFATLGAGVFAYSAFDNDGTRAAVAMAVEGIERIAPPAERRRDVEPMSEPAEDRLSPAGAAAPILVAQNDEFDAEDALADNEDPEIIYSDPSAEIVITVDGAPARAIGAEKPKPAAWSPVTSPDTGLQHKSAYGFLPRIGTDGRKPSQVYAQQFKPDERPRVALIVGGLGINRALTERAIDELPPYVTLAFAPYAKDLTFWTKRARDAGHEVMIEIPMENRVGDEQALGPAALLTSRSAEENMQRLDWILSRFGGYFGVTNYLGAKFSGDRDAIEPVLRRIEAAGLAYVDDTGALARIRASGAAQTVNRVIDPGYGSGKSQSQRDLEALEKIALNEGDALGKTYVHDETLDAIANWARSLETREIALAPASAVLALRAGDR